MAFSTCQFTVHISGDTSRLRHSIQNRFRKHPSCIFCHLLMSSPACFIGSFIKIAQTEKAYTLHGLLMLLDVYVADAPSFEEFEYL